MPEKMVLKRELFAACDLSRWNLLRVRLEEQLRHHHLPGVTPEAVPVFRLGMLPVPGHDSQDGGEGGAHPGGRFETTSDRNPAPAVAGSTSA